MKFSSVAVHKYSCVFFEPNRTLCGFPRGCSCRCLMSSSAWRKCVFQILAPRLFFFFTIFTSAWHCLSAKRKTQSKVHHWKLDKKHADSGKSDQEPDSLRCTWCTNRYFSASCACSCPQSTKNPQGLFWHWTVRESLDASQKSEQPYFQKQQNHLTVTAFGNLMLKFGGQ